MPELPEVETTVNGLRKTVVGLTIKDVWTDLAKKTAARPDYRESIKYAPFFEEFRAAACGRKVLSAERRAKNILINLSGGKTILIHMKMTGHLMYGAYAFDETSKQWAPAEHEKNEALRDPFNRFLHFVVSFTNGKHLVLSDVRKFAKITLLSTTEAHATRHLDGLGPEPLSQDFTVRHFKERLGRKKTGKIKTVLMDQSVVAGVGNIYSDEALWLAGIHPLSVTANIPEPKLTELFHAVVTVLAKGIDFGGDSTSDYRQIDGTRGAFSHEHNAYRRTGAPCRKRGCKGAILRTVVGGRSAHFCPVHQTKY